MALINLSIYFNWGNIKSIYNNNKFEIEQPICVAQWIVFYIRQSRLF